jgi:MerR family transcriptional regulator, light-induced transcriptional regulator
VKIKNSEIMEEGLIVYSIKDLENFSGIKAHTIRIWEKRYKILEPARKDSNIRMYNESELKKILNVAYLNRNGFKISKIALLDEDDLTGQVMIVSSRHDNPDQNFQPGKVLMSSLRFSEDQFKAALLPFIKIHGIEEAYLKFLQPLLVKSRILWQTGSLSRAQEQFVRNTIKQIIIVEDYQIRVEKSKSVKVVAMINTSDNFSDSNFLFYKYALRKRGFEVLFTGDILPASEVIEMHKIKPFKLLVVNSGSFDYAKKKTEYFNSIGKLLQLKKIVFTDYPEAPAKKTPEKIILASDPADFIDKISLLE